MAKTLTANEARALIQACRVGHLGCVVDGGPYVVPINYVFENESIYSHSLPGLKIEAMRAQPRVCMQVEEIESDFKWRSALAFGKYEEIRLPEERRLVLSKLLARFPMLTPVESLIAQDASAPDSIVFRVVVDHVTGAAEDSLKD